MRISITATCITMFLATLPQAEAAQVRLGKHRVPTPAVAQIVALANAMKTLESRTSREVPSDDRVNPGQRTVYATEILGGTPALTAITGAAMDGVDDHLIQVVVPLTVREGVTRSSESNRPRLGQELNGPLVAFTFRGPNADSLRPDPDHPIHLITPRQDGGRTQIEAISEPALRELIDSLLVSQHNRVTSSTAGAEAALRDLFD